MLTRHWPLVRGLRGLTGALSLYKSAISQVDKKGGPSYSATHRPPGDWRGGEGGCLQSRFSHASGLGNN